MPQKCCFRAFFCIFCLFFPFSYYLAQKYLHTLGQSSFIDQIVLMTQIQITQYFIWFPWAAITATIRRGILSQSFSRYSGVTCLHTFLASFFPIFDNDSSISNKCHFQMVKARATGLHSYEISFNVVLGSYKIFYIIL